MSLATCGDAVEGLGCTGGEFCKAASPKPSALQHVMETLLRQALSKSAMQ